MKRFRMQRLKMQRIRDATLEGATLAHAMRPLRHQRGIALPVMMIILLVMPVMLVRSTWACTPGFNG